MEPLALIKQAENILARPVGAGQFEPFADLLPRIRGAGGGREPGFIPVPEVKPAAGPERVSAQFGQQLLHGPEVGFVAQRAQAAPQPLPGIAAGFEPALERVATDRFPEGLGGPCQPLSQGARLFERLCDGALLLFVSQLWRTPAARVIVQTVELVIGPPVEPRADPIPIHFVDVGDLVNGVPTIRKQNRVRPHSTARRHIRLHDLLELLTLCFGERLDELRGSFHSPLILSQNLCLGAYEHLPAAEAFALAERFEFHYTPKSASWLNMIEIEFSA